MKHRILVIDDSELDLSSLKRLLETEGYYVQGFQDPEDGIAYVRQNRGAFSLAIVDYNIPGTTGSKVAEDLKQLDPSLQIATYSGDSRPDVYESLAMGSEYFIQKSLEADKILAIVKMFCTRFEQRNRAVREEPVNDADLKLLQPIGMIGRSRHLVDVARLIHTYAPLDEPILITGENGTGKEMIALALHSLSSRRGRFVPVNCGAISPELLESEFFGHTKGSFSGAIKDKIGLIQSAAGGTLFLDEIGDLPFNLQVKLLRFFQEDEIRPVGSNQTFKVNTRVVVATNVNLEKAVAENRFRQDLYYRIKGFPIQLKPLRERQEDIPALVLHFSKVSQKDFLGETVKFLQRYDWPGNVRELENEVRRSATLSPSPKVTIADINEGIRNAVEKPSGGFGLGLGLDYEEFKERQRRRDEEEERRFLTENSKTAGSIRELARDILRVSNSTLQGRLKALGIDFKAKPNTETKGTIHETT